MKPFPLGNEVVALEGRPAQLDGGGNPVRNAYNQIVYQDAAVQASVPGCSVRELSATEHDLNVHPTDVVVRVMMPVTYLGPDGVTVMGTPNPGPEQPVTWLRTGASYVVQGRGRLVDDVSSNPDHIVFVARGRSG